jgi:hypothetical protein
MSTPMNHPTTPAFQEPKKSPLLGILGLAITTFLPVLFILGLLISWLTSCHGGQPRDVLCVPDVAQWAKFITGASFFLSFLTVPAGIIVSIIAIAMNRGRVWGAVGILLCAGIVLTALISNL